MTTTSSINSVPKGSPVNQPAVLVLADGRIFRGHSFGATGRTLGEAVFTTGMTGYQETMTDPSYRRQIVVATAPQIGNTGWNDEDNESRDNRIWVAGLVIRDLARQASNWRSKRTLEEEMQAQGIVGIKNIDTRAVVRHLRNDGAMSAGIFSGEEALKSDDELLKIVQDIPSMAGLKLADEVCTDDVYEVPAEGEEKHVVVAFDMGIKTNTPRNFAARGIRTVVAPASTDWKTVQSYNPDGVFISNGPGDPKTADDTVATLKEVLKADIPFFGICFGNQIFGRALGMDTYKLKFGHRGINVPVVELATSKVSITAQNHGFALKAPSDDFADEFDTEFGPAKVTHVCPNDDVVEGVALTSGRAFSVQYHPEAAAGPHDANELFDQFLALLDSSTGTATGTDNGKAAK